MGLTVKFTNHISDIFSPFVGKNTEIKDVYIDDERNNIIKAFLFDLARPEGKLLIFCNLQNLQSQYTSGNKYKISISLNIVNRSPEVNITHPG